MIKELIRKEAEVIVKQSQVIKLPYTITVYIQQEGEKFLVYVGTQKIHEFYKEFDTKQEALKEFNNQLVKLTKGYEKL